MRRALFWVVFGGAVALGLTVRLADPAVRPMHHDEANQAVRFGILLESGNYHYDRHDHHGPTLYYLTLPFAWMRGQRTLAALDERTLRLVPAVFGAGLLLLFLLLSRAVGRTAAAAAAALAALSPVLTYYSRFYIQESLFVFFAFGFLIALGRYTLRPDLAPAVWAGALAGLAFSTKETSLIVLPAAAAACTIAALVAREERGSPRAGPRTHALHGLAALGAALLPTLLLYSGFFRNPAGLLDAFSTFSVYVSRGMDPGPHVQPWFYYLRTLAWSSSGGLIWTEGLVLLLAAVGIAHALMARRTEFWPLCISLYAIATMTVFSAIRYKTPWNLMPSYVAIVAMAGIGAAAVLRRPRSPVVRALVAAVLIGAACHLAAQSVRASLLYPADERNPYAYAQTSTDFTKLVSRVHDLAAQHPDGSRMLVKVVAGPYEQWPFPWYARDLARVGYWAQASDAGALDSAPVIVASLENTAAIDAAVGDRYVSEFYGLRPGVLLTLYVERGLWERFLESRQ